MATSGQFYWPSVGSPVAAYGQFFMAANTPAGRKVLGGGGGLAAAEYQTRNRL